MSRPTRSPEATTGTMFPTLLNLKFGTHNREWGGPRPPSGASNGSRGSSNRESGGIAPHIPKVRPPGSSDGKTSPPGSKFHHHHQGAPDPSALLDMYNSLGGGNVGVANQAMMTSSSSSSNSHLQANTTVKTASKPTTSFVSRFLPSATPQPPPAKKKSDAALPQGKKNAPHARLPGSRPGP
eukprot:PhM_4_TR2484/c0_g1_i1/m.33940